MKQLLWLAIFGFTYHNSKAQSTDTIYYDKKWNKTNQPEFYHFYRTISFDSTANLYEIKDHYANKKMQMHGHFSSLNPEIREGEFVYYNPNGKITDKLVWIKGIIAETFTYDSLGKQNSHTVKNEYLQTLTREEKLAKYGIKEIDEIPVYPDGKEALPIFLKENLKYPDQAVKQRIEGLIMITARIDRKGRLQSLKIAVSGNTILEQEAMRVAGLMPKKGWKPGYDKGKAVDADFSIPFRFQLK
ncbi:MAG: energy transducer TonB [Pseudosphingobacterium sp.]|uniref:energy transducer TonB n=1 Tax=Olivibacter jilunii TaxID=985016 RepID=UPI0029A4E1C3|nr:energy transducer TonB [Pseudosphingobacterium sp.]